MFKKLLIGSALLLGLSAHANAALISGDWKVAGDNQSILDDVSGKEWLNLKNTDNMSIATVQSKLDTTFAGWRLPTRREVYDFMKNSLPGANLSYSGYKLGVYGTKGTTFTSKMGKTYSNLGSYGLFINDEKSKFGGSDVLMSGVRNSYGAYSNDNRGDLSYSHGWVGVYLVSDGGVSLSSTLNPALNANNPDAPVNQVPLPATGLLLALAMTGFSVRRKQSGAK